MKNINDNRNYYRTIYLNSQHWHDLRCKKLKENIKCNTCKGTSNLDVHHINYHNLYDVSLDDLVVLCRKCHIKTHIKLNKQKNKIDTLKKKRKTNKARNKVIRRVSKLLKIEKNIVRQIIRLKNLKF